MKLIADSGDGFAYSHRGMVWYTSPSECAMSIKFLNGIVLNKQFRYFHGVARYKFTDYLMFTTLDNVGLNPKVRLAPQLNELIDLIGQYVDYYIRPDPMEVNDGHGKNWATYRGQWYCFDPIYSGTLQAFYSGTIDFNKVAEDYGYAFSN